MESSSSSSNDELPLMTESLNFDETTFSVLPVIIDSQTVSMTEFEQDPLEGEGDTLLSVPFTPTVITLEDGTQATIISDSLDATGVVLDDKGELVLPEDTEEDDVGVIVTEDSSPVLEAMQMEVGTVAYIYSQPQEGCQVLELDDGTIAYITLKEPKEPMLIKEKANPQVEAVSKKQKTFLCPREGCGRLYTSAHHLKVHERTHTGSRPYQCTEEGCTKAFSTDYSRKAHVRTHTGEKPYSCPESNCAKSFKTSGDLQKHIRTHTGERPFTCPVEGCNRAFTTSNIRKVHIRTHTGERPYVCSSCDKAFASATNYKNHVRIHSGEKPYCCNVAGCDRRFTEYSSLYKHHMVHTQEKPYQCGMCGRSYRQVSTLTVHKRTSHGVIEADDGTEIVLGNVFTQKVLNNTSTTMIAADTRKIKTVKTVSSKLLNDGEYIGLLDSEGSIQRISSEQLFIIEDIREHLKALQHIQDPDDEELKAALDPLQEQ